jgi:uncharacterized protein (TIGR02147 family)
MSKVKAQEEFISILMNEYTKRKSRNLRYSLRSFASSLDINHSTLSQILSKKRGMSVKLAEKIASKLPVLNSEKKRFVSSVANYATRSEKEASKIREKFNKLMKFKDVKILNNEIMEPMGHWIPLTAFELIATARANTLDELQKQLSLTKEQTIDLTENLCKTTLVIKEAGFFKVSHVTLQTLNDIPSHAIRKLHKSVAEKSIAAIETQPVQEREFQSAILSVAKADIPKAKEVIRDFIADFSSQFYKDDKHSEIYALSLNFFKIIGSKTK